MIRRKGTDYSQNSLQQEEFLSTHKKLKVKDVIRKKIFLNESVFFPPAGQLSINSYYIGNGSSKKLLIATDYEMIARVAP